MCEVQCTSKAQPLNEASEGSSIKAGFWYFEELLKDSHTRFKDCSSPPIGWNWRDLLGERWNSVMKSGLLHVYVSLHINNCIYLLWFVQHEERYKLPFRYATLCCRMIKKLPCTLYTGPNNRIGPALQGHIRNDWHWRSTCSTFSAAYIRWRRSDMTDCLSFLMPCMFGQECHHPPLYGSGVSAAHTKHNSTNHTTAQVWILII